MPCCPLPDGHAICCLQPQLCTTVGTALCTRLGCFACYPSSPAPAAKGRSWSDVTQSGCLQEQLRLEKLLEEEKLLTFKPQINPYPDVQPRLSLRNPDAYLQQVRSKEAARMALQLEMRRQREVSCRVYRLACVCACEDRICTGWGGG